MVAFFELLVASHSWLPYMNLRLMVGWSLYIYKLKFQGMELKGMTFDHDFYVVVGKQFRTKNAYAGHQHNIFI